MVWTRSMTRRQDEEDQALIDMIPSQLSSLFSSQNDQPHSALGRAMYRANDIHKSPLVTLRLSKTNLPPCPSVPTPILA